MQAALERDIRDTLAQWREALGTCQAVFVHAPGSNSLTLFGGQDPPLDRADPRIRWVPMTPRGLGCVWTAASVGRMECIAAGIVA